MYSQKEINYGDELTFDYCSFTESEKEFQNSICLCGSAECRGYYLSWNRNHLNIFQDAQQFLLDNPDNSFLLWNGVILKSCLAPFDTLKEEELRKHSIAENIFKNSPTWLKSWAFFVLEQIIKERKKLYKFYITEGRYSTVIHNLLDPKEKERFWRYEIENLFKQRVQNLIISLNKVANFLDHQEVKLKIDSPVVVKTLKESANHSKSLLQNVLNNNIIRNLNLRSIIEDFLVDNKLCSKLESQLPEIGKNHALKNLMYSKLLLLEVSEHFRRDPQLRKTHLVLSDILYFHSMTKMSFTMNQFSGFNIELHVKDCDLTNAKKLLQKNYKSRNQQLLKTQKIIYTTKKRITRAYLYGQLVY